MKKKIFTLLLTTVFCFSLVACSGAEDSQKTTTKKEKTTTVEKQETEESTSEKEPQELETTTKEEETTTEKDIKKFDSYLNISVNPYLAENQDVILEVFNGKSFKKGDTFDCRAEIQNLGYDLEKYSLTFSTIYATISNIMNTTTFECNDFVLDEFYWRPLVDANNNFTGTNITEEPFHLEISFDIEHDKMNYSIVFD